MSENEIFLSSLARPWIAFAALAVGGIVRVLKKDSRAHVGFFGRFPWLYPYVAVGLGLAFGVVEHLAFGVAWRESFVGGLVAGACAVLGHEMVAKLLPGGDVPLPRSMRKKTPSDDLGGQSGIRPADENRETGKEAPPAGGA